MSKILFANIFISINEHLSKCKLILRLGIHAHRTKLESDYTAGTEIISKPNVIKQLKAENIRTTNSVFSSECLFVKFSLYTFEAFGSGCVKRYLSAFSHQTLQSTISVYSYVYFV